MRRAVHPSRALAASALASALAAGGCHFAGATTHNLDELHWSDGRHRRNGDLMSPTEWALRSGLRGLVTGFGAKDAERKPQPIDDPVGECLDNVRELAHFDASDPAIAHSQVEYFARLAVNDPWQLTREVAVRELGAAAVRLKLAQHPARALPETPAGVEEVREAVRALVQASGGVLRTSDVDPAAQAAFDEACAKAAALELDLDGALRLLRTVAIFERTPARDDPRLARLRELALDLERRCTGFALAHALGDEAPAERAGVDPGWRKGRVRAAAVVANVRAFGDARLAELLRDLLPRERDVEVVIALAELVQRRGLPEAPASVAEGERGALRERWIEILLAIAIEHPDSRARLAAMGALAKVSGNPASLREEDWQRWWDERRRNAAGSAAP